MYEKFTDRAKKVMQVAQHEAQRCNHEAVSTEHVLLGLARDSSGVAANVLKKLDVDFRKVRGEAEKLVPAKKAGRSTDEKLPLSAGAKQLVEFAREESANLGHNHVGTEHLLLAVPRVNEGVALRILANLGLKVEAIREEVLKVLGVTPASASSELFPVTPGISPISAGSPVLPSHTDDLTALVKLGKLDPLIGRAAELDEMVQVISCLYRHRLLLIGEPGVGKRALLRGLAARVAREAVPEGLPKRVLRLEMGLVLLGSGDAPPASRLGAILKEVRSGGAVLGVEGISLLFRPSNEGLANLFRAWVSCGTGPLVVSLTTEEFRVLEESEREFLGLFERLHVPPSSPADALEVLRGLREGFQAHHRVKIAEEALSAAVEGAELSDGLKLPGSAIRLLDRAAAKVRFLTAARAPGVKELDGEIAQVDREKENAVANQDFEKAASLRDRAEKLRTRRDQAIREWEAVAGPTPEGVDARLVRETASRIGARAADRTGAG